MHRCCQFHKLLLQFISSKLLLDKSNKKPTASMVNKRRELRKNMKIEGKVFQIRLKTREVEVWDEDSPTLTAEK